MQNNKNSCLDDIDFNKEKAELFADNQRIMRHTVNGFLRLLILWIISKQETIHGYGIMKEIDFFFEEHIKEGIMKKSNSSKVYPILQKMEETDIIIGEWKTHNNKKVKFYSTTSKGERLLNHIRIKSRRLSENPRWTSFFKDMSGRKIN